MTITLYELVMAFGALVAGIGLVLLFRKQEQQSLSKIKIFGQELQFSAPGLVVTLAGCALVVLLPVLGKPDSNVFVFGSNNPFGGNYVVGREHHSFDTAYPIKLGSSTKGTITKPEDRDFFKLQIPASLTGLPKVRVIAEKAFAMTAEVFDNDERKVNTNIALDTDPVSLSFEGASGAYYYIVVGSFTGGRGDYLLKVKQE